MWFIKFNLYTFSGYLVELHELKWNKMIAHLFSNKYWLGIQTMGAKFNKQTKPNEPNAAISFAASLPIKKIRLTSKFHFFYTILNLALLLHILHCLFKLTCHIRFTLNRLCKVWRTTLLASTDTFFENPNEPPPFLHKVLRKVKYRNFEWENAEILCKSQF